MTRILLLLFLLLGQNSYAAKIELIARADSFQSYRLPLVSYITNATVTHNSKGDTAFSFVAIIDNEVRTCIWYSPMNSEQGRIIHIAKKDNTLSDPSLNESGDLVFAEYNEAQVQGLFVYSSSTDQVRSLLVDKRFISIRDPKINSHGGVIFRASDKAGVKSIIYQRDGVDSTIISSKDVGVSYIFSANFLNEDSIILKTRRGLAGEVTERQPDHITQVTFAGDRVVRAEDRDSDERSSIIQFNNTIGSSAKSSQFAFIGTNSNSSRALYRSVGNKLELIVEEGKQGIKQLEYFAPSINSSGNIAFRAIDDQGKRGIFWSDGKIVKSYLKAGDLIDTDITTAKIHAARGPSFGGGLTINELDEVVFQAKVFTKELEKDLGTVVLKASF
ncbi:hypothetical protein [Halobacteriovorax sp. HLS]|uniref:hypothetical protein n=1 Tax=Halobacteriovorax sp. HLS TaxID=2234000 RepID=UPI000FD7F91D|nr:hypothetical protein [Halobacteriovorax sp. HLS]